MKFQIIEIIKKKVKYYGIDSNNIQIIEIVAKEYSNDLRVCVARTPTAG